MSAHKGMFRIASMLFVAATLAAVGCDRDRGLGLIGTNAFLVEEQVTSEKYNKWVQAQANLNRDATDADIVSMRERLGISRTSRAALDSAVARLERNERTKAAIESAGLSVREYVLTSLALSQAFAASNPRGNETFRGVPAQNVELVSRHRADIRRLRGSSRLRVVGDDDDDDDDDDEDEDDDDDDDREEGDDDDRDDDEDDDGR